MNEVQTYSVSGDLPRESARVEGATPPAAQANKLLRALRGRWRWAAPLGLALGAAGAVLGWFGSTPRYQSTGLIEIRAVLPRVLYQSEQNSVQPMFDSYLASQASLLASRRVVDMAMGHKDWQQLGRGLADRAVNDFMRSIEVNRPKNSEIIQVTFTDRDPAAAPLGSRVLIEAFRSLYEEQDAQSNIQRMELLRSRRTNLNAQLLGLQERIAGIAGEFGPEGLLKLQQFKLDEVNKLESRLRELEVAIALASGKPADAAGAAPDETDPRLLPLVQRRVTAQAQVEFLARRLGENHPKVEEARAQLQALTDQIEVARQGLELLPDNPSGSRDREVPLPQLRAQQEQLKQLHEQLNGEAKELGRKNRQIESLRTDMDTIQEQLNETRARLEQLSVEGSVSGRLRVISTGERPVAPSNDKRTQLAVVGGLGGAGLGFGCVVLVGLLGRRIRYADEALWTAGNTRLLGILPHLPEDLADQAQAAIAANCVHHIRAMLQMGAGGPAPRVLAVTSASPRSGKTSLALALGLSYAESGARVLLVDGDLSGAGLTTRLNIIIRQRLGRLLLNRGSINAQQLEAALQLSQERGRRLGEVLISQGLISSEELDTVLTAQESCGLGLPDALAGDEVGPCIAETGMARLSILPAGDGTRRQSGRVSPTAAAALMEQLRQRFDQVIIDTGPLLGTVESTILCASADQTIFVVARGDARHLAERALGFLQSATDKPVGMVFNRADETDLEQAFYSQPADSAAENAAAGNGRPGPADAGPDTASGNADRPIARALVRRRDPAGPRPRGRS